MELFFDFGANKMNQTRTAPFGVRVGIDSWIIQIQPMWIHLQSPEQEWETRFVSNFEITYNF